LALDGFELLGAENRVGEQGANVSPNEADEHGSDQVRQQQPHESDSAQGSCATRVPGEKAKKSVKQKHGHSDGGCLPPNEAPSRSEEHTSELQSRGHLVCRLLLEKKKQHKSRVIKK